MSFDDLYNNFKIIEQEVKGTTNSSSSSSYQNMAFVSSPSSTNEVNTAYEVNTSNIQVIPASTQVNTASTQVSTANLNDLEEMDLKWQLALLSMRTRNFFQKTGRKITINGSDTAGYDKTVIVEETSSKAMLAIDGAGFDWSYMTDDEVPTNMALMAFSNYEITDKSRKGVGFVSYNVVPPPPTGLFLPPKLDLSNSSLEEFQQPEFEGYGPKTSKSVSEDICNEVRESLDTPLVEELVLNDKLEKKIVFPTVEFVRPKQQENPVRKPVKYAEMLTAITIKGKGWPKAVNTARPNSAVVNVVRANQVNVGHPQKDQGYVDSGCSRHMTRNMSYLSDFKEFDGGYVTIGGGAIGGRITGKGTLKNSKLDFKDVYFVKELQFNIFSVSQIYDKKNSVLFTDTGCFVLSPGFKLVDESQVLLKVPRKNNMYSVDMKNIVPKESLTCLIAKATLDESMLWHRRLGHQNGVAKKRNRTLIVAARTMLADSKLPTTFWAEAVNTACYVQNRVLVVKPHNKAPYELFRGRTPALSFVRPFGCHVTILNTLDYLGKFDRKLDEGFFIRYSLNSKAFRVYNIRTRKVEEILHIRFLEDKPIIAGDGPKWLFDIDVLTKSMNFMPVVAGTNSNDSVGTKESVGTGHSTKETGSSQDYILMPLWKDGSLFDSSSNNARNDEQRPSNDVVKKNDEVQTGSLNIVPLEATHVDFFGDETELDMSNIITTYPVPSTPNTRIHTDHSLDHVIGDVQFGVQTRRMTKTTNEQGFISVVYEGKTYEYLHTCLFACFLSQEEPKKVWTLVDLPYGNRAIGTKWVYINKKDERGIVIRNKARLMDVKSAFLYGKIEEEVYVCQPPGFEDPDFPDRVYKVEKALYGLHHLELGLQVTQKNDRIFISQDKYVDEILKKFGFSTVKTASTPMETSKPLLKDVEAEDVDVHLYRPMIGSLMYLTASRPDIIFAVCACVRFQVTPKASHLHVVKRIFRYLKGQPKLGLWYPKDLPFDLKAYTDSDYVGASLDRKSTTGGGQFLGSRLMSWQCKKQIIVANSTTEAEYIAAASSADVAIQVSVVGLTYYWYVLTENPTIYVHLIQRFWQTATANILDNEEVEITATIDGKVTIVTKASIRRHLNLEDSDGISTLPTTESFEQLALMGSKKTA
ncbi:ribonuclease H-like domain-containing protein [Tanacetum coccineum]